MPELPEVETIRRELDPELAGRRIRAARIHHPDIVMDPRPPGGLARGVAGARVRAVDRRGKSLLIRLARSAGRPQVLQVQLRMTGRFALARGEPRADLTHLAAEFDLDDGRTLYYDDVRRLGGFRLLSEADWRAAERSFGPEPLASSFTARRLREALAPTRAPVKNALLDQRRVAGIGNIYASEALHAAGLDPRRPARELAPDEVRRLHRSVRRVLREATAASGTTFSSYRALDGRSGAFQRRLAVYGREGRSCPRCGTPIRRIVQAGRSTFFCPTCQE